MDNETRIFLEALWGNKPNNPYILVWTLPDKKSHWFRTVNEASTFAGQDGNRSLNVYTGVALSPKDYGPKLRCEAPNTAGIGGLWMDLDILDSAHKKKNLPPSIEDARSLLDGCGLPPNIVIHSGHGLQAWWLFKYIWMFLKPEDRARAAILTERWKVHFREMGKTKGWEVDATHDLARVMRMPGTFNQNGTPVVPVKILSLDCTIRYDHDEIEDFLDGLGIAGPQPGKILSWPGKAGSQNGISQNGSFVLNSEATPPFDKFNGLCEIEPKFRQSWERKRKDLQDASASGYDMSLANFAFQAGWSDQEIVDLLAANSRKHGGGIKREGYYKLTLEKARAHEAVFRPEELEEEGEGEEVAQTPPNPATASKKKDADNTRQTKLKTLSEVLGVKLVKVVKFLSDPPTYTLQTVEGSVELGPVSSLIGQARLRDKLADASGIYIKNFKPAEWSKVAQALLDICEEGTLSADTTRPGLAKAWIDHYLESMPEPSSSMNDEVVNGQFPFIYEKSGQVAIFLESFLYALSTSPEHPSRREVALCLKAYGCEYEKINVYLGKKRTSRGIWLLPDSA
jgi:hypothetical protein